MTGRREFANESGVRAFCTRCGATCPEGTMSCPCTESGGETVLGATAITHGDTTPNGSVDTTPNGNDLVSEPSIKVSLETGIESTPFAEATDEDIEHFTTVEAPRSTVVPEKKTPRPPLSPASSDARESDDDDAGTNVLSQNKQLGQQTTTRIPRTPNLAKPAQSFGSSEPPTRFLRGVDEHIELPSGSIVDDYEVDGKLGAGAMGVVYSARHMKLGRRVALKVIAPSMGRDPQALARFEREARGLASLHHPNIVDVTAFGTLPDQRSYFIMEYLEGDSLDIRLERGRVPLDEALDILDQIARALEAAHTAGIVHRDLKPSNTFLQRIPRERYAVVKLLDFGLIKPPVADAVHKTASGAVIGTALYLSPEQCRSPDVDGRSDIYALGCIAYELVLGRHPFPEARTPTAAIASHLTEPPPQPRSIWPGIPAALDLLLYSMLAKDPNYRPSLAQVRHVIASVRSPTTAAGREMRAATETVRPHAGPSRAWTAALTLFGLVVGIAAGASMCGGKSDEGITPPTSPVGSRAGHTERTDGTTAAITSEPIADASVATAAADAATPTSPVPSTSVVDGQLAAAPIAIEPKVSRPPTSPTPAKPAGVGTLSVHSRPTTEVLVDGQSVGWTSIEGLKIPAGPHKVTFRNPKYDINVSYRIEVRAGQLTPLDKNFNDRVPDAQKTLNPYEKKGSPSK